MTLAETYSWIFYAIGLASRNKPASIAEIERVADGINHAVPTQKEIQTSISWLKKHALIIKSGKKIELSGDGINLINKFSSESQTILGVWKQVENHFVDIGIDNSQQINPKNMITEQKH